MIQLPVFNKTGQQVATFDLDEAILGSEVRPALLKQAYVMMHANRRQGSARTRNRSRVEGSTRKLYKQKGTGNARRGTVRTNLMKGGGRAFAKVKTREDYRLDMPRKMRRLANRNALLAKAVDQEIKVIDDLGFDRPRTREFETLLQAVGVNRTCLVALDSANRNGLLSARNLHDVDTIRWDQLNVFELLNHRFLVIDRASLEAFVEARHLGQGADAAARSNGAAKAAPAGGRKSAASDGVEKKKSTKTAAPRKTKKAAAQSEGGR